MPSVRKGFRVSEGGPGAPATPGPAPPPEPKAHLIEPHISLGRG